VNKINAVESASSYKATVLMAQPETATAELAVVVAVRPKVVFPEASLFTLAFEVGVEKLGFTPPILALVDWPLAFFVDFAGSFFTLVSMLGLEEGFRVVAFRFTGAGAGLSLELSPQLDSPRITTERKADSRCLTENIIVLIKGENHSPSTTTSNGRFLLRRCKEYNLILI